MFMRNFQREDDLQKEQKIHKKNSLDMYLMIGLVTNIKTLSGCKYKSSGIWCARMDL